MSRLNSNGVEAAATAIIGAEVGYEMKLSRLVDGVSTYTLKLETGEQFEFGNTDEVYEKIATEKAKRQAIAAITAYLSTVSPLSDGDGRALTKCDPPSSAEDELAAFDPLVDEWAVEINWRDQLDELISMSTGFAGKRISGPGGAECKMLILRQRNLFDRYCRQAYLEGIFRGQGLKFTAAGREALARITTTTPDASPHHDEVA